MYRKLVVIVSFFLALSALAELQKTSELSQKLSLPYEKYTLANGLDVILSVDKSTPFVAVNLWYQVGSVSEKPTKTGLAHLFEHLMFEGSRHVPASQHFRMLEHIGAFDVNASTSFDRTNYYQTVPKSQLELTLSLESSRMYFLVIDQEKLDEQRAVVRREREQRTESQAYGLATQKLWQSVFPASHPFHGKVIGSHEDLQRASLRDVQEFYDMHYGPENASLTLVGDFDIDEAKALISKYFATLPKGVKIPTPKLPPLAITGSKIIRVDEKLGKLPLIRMHYLTPALFQPGDAEMDMLGHILAGGEFGRLTKALTRDKSLASTTMVYQQSMEQISVFSVDVVLNPGVDENEVVQEIDTVLSGLITNPPSAGEIERARNSILKNQLFSLQTLGGYTGRAEMLQSYNRFANNPGFLKDDIARYQAVDQKSLESYAKAYLKNDARTILIAKPIEPRVAIQGK